MPLVTILQREMRKKVQPTFGDVASATSHDIGASSEKETRLNFFQVDQALGMLRVPLVTILAREMRLKFFLKSTNFGDVASAASHDIGARNAIEIWRPKYRFRLWWPLID